MYSFLYRFVERSSRFFCLIDAPNSSIVRSFYNKLSSTYVLAEARLTTYRVFLIIQKASARTASEMAKYLCMDVCYIYYVMRAKLSDPDFVYAPCLLGNGNAFLLTKVPLSTALEIITSNY